VRSLKRPKVEWFTISESELNKWFQKRVGVSEWVWYESAACNFLIAHSKLVCPDAKYTWSELFLGTLEERGRLRPDVIFESNTHLWIFEVKYPINEKQMFGEDNWKGYGVEDQLNSYFDRIIELGWWKGKEIILAVFWVYGDDIRKRKKFAEDHRLLNKS
jgi:hypothetical protein